MSKDRIDVSDNTAISMPMRNLMSIVAAVAVGVWAYFGVLERITMLETKSTLAEKDLNQAIATIGADLEKNTEFRIKWPRGEMASIPADAQQDMLIEFMATQIEAMQEEMEGMMSNTVNIKRAQQDIEKLIIDTEKLEDKVRQNGSH